MLYTYSVIVCKSLLLEMELDWGSSESDNSGAIEDYLQINACIKNTIASDNSDSAGDEIPGIAPSMVFKCGGSVPRNLVLVIKY